MPEYLTAPIKSTRMPPGVAYIVGNEAAERFSYYGMRSILTIFMTKYLLDRSGVLAPMSADQAKAWYHWFISAVYFCPFFGAIVADAWLGKYRTILFVSIIYCLGHLALAVDPTRLGLAVGLSLIAIGSGGIKPCVSANVGDQFGATNQHLLPKVFGWFYFSINFGSFFSTLLIPKLLHDNGPHVAFAVPGVLMLIATIVFWFGRNQFVHISPQGMKFIRDVFSPLGLQIVLRLFVIYLFVAVFWALYDQTGSAWVLQAQQMDLNWLGHKWLPSQVQAVNPLLILIFIPSFSYGVYPAINKVFPLTPLRKISLGLFLTAISFVIPAFIETRISAGEHPTIGWQVLAYALLTAAEVLVSITCLEFSYTQAPNRMKSFVMALFLASVSLGDAFTATVNTFIQNPDKSSKLPGASYYLFFMILMFVTAVLFIVVAWFYKERTYLQDEQGKPS